MAELATIARPYANAVFELAKRDASLEAWSSMLALLNDVSRDERVALLLDSPDLAAAEKAQKLADICGEDIDASGRLFLQSMADNDRLSLIGEVREQFETLRAEEQRSLGVEVVSAFPLTEQQSDELKNALSRRFNKDITIEASTDSSLLGGALIRAGDMVIDGSVRGKLNKLADTLAQI